MDVAFETVVLLIVRREMLGCRDRLQVFRIVPLQAPDEGRPDLSGQEGVLAVSLGRPSPARITRHVDRRRPESQQITIQIGLERTPAQLVPAGPGLIGNGRRDLQDQIRIPSRSQTDSLREDGETSGTDDAVKCLIAMVILRETQPLVGRRGSPEQIDLFIDRHALKQVLYPLLQRGVFVLIHRALPEDGHSQQAQKASDREYLSHNQNTSVLKEQGGRESEQAFLPDFTRRSRGCFSGLAATSTTCPSGLRNARASASAGSRSNCAPGCT